MSSPQAVAVVELTGADRRAIMDGLLVRVAAGDRSAFSDLYGHVESRVFGLCLTLLRERQQAEEVTQETFLHIWQRAGAFDPALGSALAWVLRIARSKAIDRIRHSQASRVRDAQYNDWTHRPNTDTVVEQVMTQVQNGAVRRAIELLSDKQRQAIMMTYYGALTSAQISTRLGVPTSTIKTRIRDGLAKLGAHLAEADMLAMPAA